MDKETIGGLVMISGAGLFFAWFFMDISAVFLVYGMFAVFTGFWIGQEAVGGAMGLFSALLTVSSWNLDWGWKATLGGFLLFGLAVFVSLFCTTEEIDPDAEDGAVEIDSDVDDLFED